MPALLTFLLLFFARQLCTQPLSSARQAELHAFVDSTMEQARVVPGLGVAIVRDGEIIFAGGFGRRDVENDLPVTAHTGFYIASVTKSLLGLTAAVLEQENIIDLQSPIANCLPDEQFADRIDPAGITMADLLSHAHPVSNSGLQYRQAFLDEFSPRTFERLLYDFSSLREPEFEYSNTSYNLAAYCMEKATRNSWRELVASRVTGPLGMKHTTSYMSRATAREYAWPYLFLDGALRRLPVKADGQMQSAGGLVTTPADLARLLIAYMEQGNAAIPGPAVAAALQPRASLDRTYGPFHRHSYAAGLYHSDWEGEKLLHHFGGFDGYMAHMSFLPDHGIGVVVLSNEVEAGGRLPHLVATYIYEMLLDRPDRKAKYAALRNEWLVEVRQATERLDQRRQEVKDYLAGTSSRFGPQQLSGLPGRYLNPRLGSLTLVQWADDGLRAEMSPWYAQVRSRGPDTLVMDWQPDGGTGRPVAFRIDRNAEGQVRALYWGGREFHRLAAPMKEEEIEEAFAVFRSSLNAAAGEESKLPTLLDSARQQGLITEIYLEQLGRYYLHRDQPAAAAVLFGYLLQHYPESEASVQQLADALYLAGKGEEALPWYRRVLEYNPAAEPARQRVSQLEKE